MRSRSRSPRRRVSRSRSRSRDRTRHRRDRDKSYERRRRSRSDSRDRRNSDRTRRSSGGRDASRERVRRRRSRSESSEETPIVKKPPPKRGKKEKSKVIQVVDLTDESLADKTEEEIEMMRLMGFCGFSTTKNKKVDDNVEGAIHQAQGRKYRQYMNRKGGFNRPLDYVN